MKLEESVAGEDSEPEETCSELAGTHFTIRKLNSDENSSVQKVWNQNNGGIPQNSNGFPNQAPYSPPIYPHTVSIVCVQKSQKTTVRDGTNYSCA
jgi:hypothetical protein